MCSKPAVSSNGRGLPLAWTLTVANCNDVTQLLELLDQVPRFVVAATGHEYYRNEGILVDAVIAGSEAEQRLMGSSCRAR